MNCPHCNFKTKIQQTFTNHVNKCKKKIEIARKDKTSVQTPLDQVEVACDEQEQCLGGVLQTKTWKHRGSKDILVVLDKYKGKCRASVAHYLKKQKGLKFHIILKVKLQKLDGADEAEVHFCGKNKRLTDLSEYDELYEESREKIWKSFEEWIKEGSGWVIQSIEEVVLKLCKYQPYLGSSYIQSPDWVRNTLSVVNVQNEDNLCFLWHIAAALYPVAVHHERPSNYKEHLDKFDVTGISWPMEIGQIEKFERQNNLCINVYKTDMTPKNIWPIKISKKRDGTPINLLLLTTEEKSHYTWIKDFNRLFSYDAHHPKEFCYYCLHGFDKRTTNKQKMAAHMEVCYNYGPQRIKVPEEGENFIEFKNFHKMLKLPYAIYADFEALNVKVKDETTNTTHTKANPSL